MKIIPLEIVDVLDRFQQQGKIGNIKSGLDTFGSVVMQSKRGLEYALLNNSGQGKHKGGSRHVMLMPVCLIRGKRISVAEVWKDKKYKTVYLKHVKTGRLPEAFIQLLKKKYPDKGLDIQIYKTFSGRVPWFYCKKGNAVALSIPPSVYESVQGKHKGLVVDEENHFRMIVDLKPVKPFSVKKKSINRTINQVKPKIGRAVKGKCPHCGSGQLENGYGYAAGYGMGKYKFCSSCGKVCDFVQKKK